VGLGCGARASKEGETANYCCIKPPSAPQPSPPQQTQRSTMAQAGDSDLKVIARLNDNESSFNALTPGAAAAQMPRLQAPMVRGWGVGWGVGGLGVGWGCQADCVQIGGWCFSGFGLASTPPTYLRSIAALAGLPTYLATLPPPTYNTPHTHPPPPHPLTNTIKGPARPRGPSGGCGGAAARHGAPECPQHGAGR